MTRSLLGAFLLVAAVAVGGCGAVYAQGGPAGSGAASGTVGSPVAPPPSSSTSVAVADPSRITLNDNGKVLTLHVGDTFVVALGDQQIWNVSVADETVIAPVPTFAPLKDAQGMYGARRVGSTTLQATGTANCGPGRPCPLYAVSFHLTVNVVA